MSDYKVTQKGSPYEGRKVEVAKRAMNRELRTIEEKHRDTVDDLQKVNAQEIVEIRHQHDRDIAVENEKKERILTEMQKHLSSTQELTDKEIKNLKTQTEKTRIDQQVRLSEQRAKVNEDHDLNMQDTNYRYNKAIQDLNHSMENRIQDVKTNKQEELVSTERFQQNKIDTLRSNFKNQFETDAAKYEKIKQQQDVTFKKQRVDSYTHQNKELDKIATQGRKDYEQHTENYQKGLKDQELLFEKKYADALKKNQEDFKKLEELNKKSINSIKSAMHKEIKLTESRQSDPFYEFIELKPQLSKTPDGYEVRVTVPEYAKHDVIMTTNPKEIILTMNRRHTDNRKDENGTSTKINKVETLVTRLPVSDVLNAKTVKSNYDSGVLTFTINTA